MNVRRVSLAAGLVSLGALAGFGVKSFAEGIPSPSPLYYAGTLTENGTLANGARAITINVWSDGVSNGTPLCTTVAASANVNNGRFRIPLAGACKTALNNNANAWVEVIDGATSLGRSPIGAVPYAVEADHAVSATNAATAATANAAGGTLATTLSTIQGQVHPASGFHARLTTATTVPTGQLTSVAFDTVDFDSNGEFDTTTGLFKPKTAGVYVVFCEFQYVMATSTSACSATIVRNGTEVVAVDSATIPPITTGGPHCVSMVTTTLQASAGDSIGCSAFQFSAANATATLQQVQRNTFAAARLY